MAELFYGICCARCGAPIAVSSNIARRKDEPTDGPRGFAARCKQCDGEQIYPFADIKAFEGDPPTRRSLRLQGAIPHWHLAS